MTTPDNKYKIARDGSGWMVAIVRTAGPDSKKVPPGTQTIEGVTYHATLQQACESLLDRCVREGSDPGDVETVLQAVNKALQTLHGLLAGISEGTT